MMRRQRGVALLLVLFVGAVLSVIAAQLVLTTNVAVMLSGRRVDDLQVESARWSALRVAQAMICRGIEPTTQLDFALGSAAVSCRIEDESRKTLWRDLVALPRKQMQKCAPELCHLFLPYGSTSPKLPDELLPADVPLEAIYGSKGSAGSLLAHITFWGDGKVNWRAPADVLAAKLNVLGGDRIQELIQARDAGHSIADVPLNQRERELLRESLCEEGLWYSVYVEVRCQGLRSRSFHVISMAPEEPSVVFSYELKDV